MIKVRLQIGDGEILDTQDGYGLIYVSSDNRLSPPLKEFEKTSYPEEEGEHISPKTVDDAFDYIVTWFVDSKGNLNNANAIISRFNSLLYDKVGDVKTLKRVTFYNDYKKVKIVGIPNTISEASEFWRDHKGRLYDVVKVEWKIRVNKPSLCDFNLP